MVASSKPVKRAYDASRRRERAEEQRNRALDAAEAFFLQHGYVGTTVDAIAAAAGVSAATVYKRYGGKTGMVRDLCARALAGSGPVPAQARSDDLRANASAAELIEGWAGFVAEVSPRISPLLLVLRAASEVDAEARAIAEELDAARLARMAENASAMARRGLLRDDVHVDEARDVLWLCTSAELYGLLVTRRGWSPEALRRFVAATMAAGLL